MDLTSRYMGLDLKNPLVASASPLTGELDSLRQLEDAGVAAIVLPSLFQEHIEAEARRYEALTEAGADSFPEALTYFPALSASHAGPERYLMLVRAAVEAVDLPIIGSLNGTTNEGWIDFAKQIEQAGAAGIELNVYFLPIDPAMSGRAVEQRYVEILTAVRAAVAIPVAVKVGPYFSAFGQMAQELDRAGADALVLFNRFYQPDIDLVGLRMVKDLELSRRNEIRLPLLWIGVLSGNIRASLAASTGVESAEEVLKYLLAGADAVMTTSALLRHGVQHVATLLSGVNAWLSARDIRSLDQVRGLLSRRKTRRTGALIRADYIEMLQEYDPQPIA
jgi:dihydroorotate dehydrogenase (fumarate)